MDANTKEVWFIVDSEIKMLETLKKENISYDDAISGFQKLKEFLEKLK